MKSQAGESFAEFKKSFFYGKRTDLNFKFLAHLPSRDAARFFQELLKQATAAVDNATTEELKAFIVRWQSKGYEQQEQFAYPDGPFTKLEKPLAKTRLALLTSSGHFVDGDDPQPLGLEQMTQQQAIENIFAMIKEKPVLSVIAKDTPASKLRVRHGGYDISAARADHNVVFPLDILGQLEKLGTIGRLNSKTYSFVGACSQKRLIRDCLDQWVAEFHSQKIDAALLVPV